jgi:GGDEF domain-containing protein
LNFSSELEKVIECTVRGPEDKIARYKNKDSGDFIVLMAGTDKTGAVRIIERVAEKIKTPLNYGISVYPAEERNKEKLIEKAEEDLKKRKNRSCSIKVSDE